MINNIAPFHKIKMLYNLFYYQITHVTINKGVSLRRSADPDQCGSISEIRINVDVHKTVHTVRISCDKFLSQIIKYRIFDVLVGLTRGPNISHNASCLPPF